jgi:hypothetical protein
MNESNACKKNDISSEAEQRSAKLRVPTLSRVAVERIECDWEDVCELPAPLSKRVPIQVRYHPQVVFVQPDMSVAVGADWNARVLGFGLAEPFRMPDITSVSRQLYNGYMPIVQSVWNVPEAKVTQQALAYLADGDDVTTGLEQQIVFIRLEVKPVQPDRRIPLFVLVMFGRCEGSHLTNYQPFKPVVSRFQREAIMGVVHNPDERVVVVPDSGESDILVAYQCEPKNVPVRWHSRYPADSTEQSEWAGNVLAFELSVEGGTIELAVKKMRRSEIHVKDSGDERISFQEAIEKAERHWEGGLAPAMKLQTPDQRLNDIYKHLILSILQNNMVRQPGLPYAVPVHAPFQTGVWPFEFAHTIVPLIALGYQQEVKPVIRFFTERQVGVGNHAVNDKPDGEVSDGHGCYLGAGDAPHWMCETGVILWVLASEFRYSHDIEWLLKNKEGILSAWKWIQTQRERTRIILPDGTELRGLLPRGRAHDWKGYHYHFAFSDTWTWKGMAEMAMAFTEAGFSEAERMMREVEDYKECILHAVEKVKYHDPQTGLIVVPHAVDYKEERAGLWVAAVPSLFETGLLDPVTHWYWEQMDAFRERRWGSLAGLLMHFNAADEPQWDVKSDSPFWYVVFIENGYHKCLLARGEIEKALLVFYSTLASAMSRDCFQTVERIHIAQPNYAPFQPNASANGRILAMIKRMFVDEQEQDRGVLWLLRGCPRRWFKPGCRINVENVPTVFGRMSVNVKADYDTVRIEIHPPCQKRVPELRLMVRHPRGRIPRSVIIDDKPLAEPGETVTLSAPAGRTIVVYRYEV